MEVKLVLLEVLKVLVHLEEAFEGLRAGPMRGRGGADGGTQQQMGTQQQLTKEEQEVDKRVHGDTYQPRHRATTTTAPPHHRTLPYCFCAR